ncbi:MAG: carbon-nitrogen hydrolase family protein [bacterium]
MSDPMPKSRIALAQMTSTSDFDANLAEAFALIDQAAAGGAQLVAFPEVFLYLGGHRGKLENAAEVDGPLVSRFREVAHRHHIMILLGSIHERIPGREDEVHKTKVHNTSVLIDGAGEILATYRKLKLFDVELPNLTIKESDSIEPGDAPPPVVDTAIGRMGLTICFDLRFPDLYQHLRRKGAQIVFAPSNFTHPTGAAHWETLLRARALESQVYLAAPAQVGQHNAKFRSWGHTALVDPWGTVTALAPERTGLIFAEIDLDYLEQVRRELPMKVDEG